MMAKGGEGRALLPVSAEAAGKGDGEAAEVFKGSAMTRRGVLAALSYMSCSGTCLRRSAPPLDGFLYAIAELSVIGSSRARGSG